MGRSKSLVETRRLDIRIPVVMYESLEKQREVCASKGVDVTFTQMVMDAINGWLGKNAS